MWIEGGRAKILLITFLYLSNLILKPIVRRYTLSTSTDLDLDSLSTLTSILNGESVNRFLALRLACGDVLYTRSIIALNQEPMCCIADVSITPQRTGVLGNLCPPSPGFLLRLFSFLEFVADNEVTENLSSAYCLSLTMY